MVEDTAMEAGVLNQRQATPSSKGRMSQRTKGYANSGIFGFGVRFWSGVDYE